MNCVHYPIVWRKVVSVSQFEQNILNRKDDLVNGRKQKIF